MVAETQTGSIRDFPAYLHFTPRPDQPDKFDEQTAFYNCDSDGCIFLTGGNGAGCLAAEQLIYDPVKAVSLPVSHITEDFHVIARNSHGNAVRAKAEKPRIYGTEDIYEIVLSSGQFMRVTLGHRLLTRAGWREIGDIVRGADHLSRRASQNSWTDHVASDDARLSDDRIPEVQLSDTLIGRHCEVHPEETTANTYQDRSFCDSLPGRDLDHAFALMLTSPSAFQQCELHSSHKPSGFVGNYSQGLHQYDELPHRQSETGLAVLPPQGDADAHNHCWQQKDDLACRPEHTHDDPHEHRPSTHHCVRPAHLYHAEPYSFSEPCLLPCWMGNNSDQCAESNMVATQQTTVDQQSPEGIFRNCTTTSYLQSAKVFVESACEILTGGTEFNPAYITSIQFVRRDTYWDFHVPEYENYWMAGVWNHNTTSCLIAKICRFVLETPPPRRDTPFWVIAETYEQIGSMFDEKFNQQGHLPASVIDWPRIHWNNRNNNQPFRVPLKSPPGNTGKNWSLEFKSWRQGRGKMQARSLGGFGFIEQFPWGIFEEVLRGCREYNFPGSKLVEFTPVDADLSQNLEEMIENGYEPETPAPGLSYLPKNWKIFHANTLCAMEAGHVDKRWFEEFFGMVPKDMLETRLKGMFSTFEGVIYKDFNVGTHCMGDEMWGRIKNCYHRRGIDWGAGPENDFVCEWGAKNGLGQWFIYDEEVSNDQSKTTVDHLTDVYHRWEWPDDNSMYGVTYADPSSPDNIRIAGKLNQYNPSVENLSMQRGKNSVLEGIEHIQYLLKPQIPVPMVDAQGKPIIDPETGKCAVKLEPKLFIHRTNCPKLIQQMKSYRWLRGSDPTMKLSRNPRDPLRAPLKKNDHCADALRYVCFSDDFMTGSTISSAKNHSALTAQLHGEYIPRQGLRGFTTQHRERG